MLKLSAKYTLFAVVATLVNFSTQELVVHSFTITFSFWIALISGTLTGLICKYYLDKKYIFHYYTNRLSQDTRLFVLYALMGVITTCIFWGFEITFHELFSNPLMRYVGGAMGLTIGYIAKYQLDKRYVFSKSEPK